jgi:hypothetical protein
MNYELQQRAVHAYKTWWCGGRWVVKSWTLLGVDASRTTIKKKSLVGWRSGGQGASLLSTLYSLLAERHHTPYKGTHKTLSFLLLGTLKGF